MRGHMRVVIICVAHRMPPFSVTLSDVRGRSSCLPLYVCDFYPVYTAYILAVIDNII